jgi:hypothetical protein
MRRLDAIMKLSVSGLDQLQQYFPARHQILSRITKDRITFEFHNRQSRLERPHNRIE